METEKERNKKVILIKIKLNFQEQEKLHGITDRALLQKLLLQEGSVLAALHSTWA